MKPGGWAAAVLLAACTACGPGIPPKIDIHDAATRSKHVSIKATGQDLNVVNLEVTAKSRGFDFEIPAGTLLVNSSGSHQNMMVARTVVVSFKDPASPLVQPVKLDVYCVNMHKSVPIGENTFSVGSYEPESALVKFVSCLERSSEEKEVRQAAVWIMSDNPTWEQYLSRDMIERTAVAVLRAAAKESLGREPSDAESKAFMDAFRSFPEDQLRAELKPLVQKELGRARRLFRECGMPTSDRHLFIGMPD